MSEDKPAETVEKKVEELAEAKDKVEPEKVEPSIPESMKLKEENDALEAELLRKEELRARAMAGGQTQAGHVEKTDEDKDKEEAARILKPFEED